MEVCYNCFGSKSTAGPCPHCGYDPAEQTDKYPMALRPGFILNGRYVVGRVLGQGGFGITYIALDDHTQRRVAIKEYMPTEFANRTSGSYLVTPYSREREENFAYGKARFLEEARTLAEFIGDEHIVRIYSYFEENATAYFTMEYVDGLPLGEYVISRGGRLSPGEANELFLPLMEALNTVHAKGIVHRDISPDNIIITPEHTAKLIDFGAARYSTGEKSQSLDVVIRHGFAPKEQYTRRGRQGPFTDVYAMAATYYYAITGRVPPESIDRIEEDDLVLPGSLGVRIGAEAEEALCRALEVSASARFQTMGAFREALLRAEAPPESPEPDPVPSPAPVPAPEPVPVFESGASPDPGPVSARVPAPASKSPKNPKKAFGRLLALIAVAALALIAAVVIITGRSAPGPKAAEAVPSPTSLSNATAEPEPSDIPTAAPTETPAAEPSEAPAETPEAENAVRPFGWTLEDGVLTISGSGPMPDYGKNDPAPWCTGDSVVRSAVIEEGVTSVGAYAFYRCGEMTEISLPAGMTIIGEWAFGACGKLKSAALPEGVEVIGDYAFYWCSDMTELTIPDSLTSIGQYALYCCSALTSLSLPAGLERIGEYAFTWCDRLKSIDFGGSRADWDRISVGEGNSVLKKAITFQQ